MTIVRHCVSAIVICALMLVGCKRKPAASTPLATKPASPSSAAKPMHLEHAEFVLDLPPSWTRLAGKDPEQFTFQSKPLSSTLTISIMMADIPAQRMQATAQKFLELRQEGERRIAGRSVTFGDKWVTPKPEGDVVEFAYAGYDNQGRIFRFMGFVTTHKIASFYCESTSIKNEQAKQVFDECFRGFQFYVP